MINFSLLKDVIEKHNTFLITTHVNPDADALGSEMAMYYLLKKLGKSVRIVNHSATPYNLEFMDTDNVIEKYNESIHQTIFADAQVFIALDLNQTGRIVKMEKGLRDFNGAVVCMDHHLGTEPFFKNYFGGTEYCATGEVIYDFIDQTMIVEIDYNIALQLYAAIMTDTGSFRFDRTTPRVHRIIASLLEKGVDPTSVYDKIYDQFKFGRIKLLGEAFCTMQLDESKRIAHMIVTTEMLERNNATEADVDGFVNNCLSVQGVQIGILFYELKDGIKISFRSKGDIKVNELAYEFKGGGHMNASGSRLFDVTIDDVKDKVLDSAKKYLK